MAPCNPKLVLCTPEVICFFLQGEGLCKKKKKSMWHLLSYFIFTRVRSSQKWTISDISGLELYNSHFPEFKSIYADLYGVNYFPSYSFFSTDVSIVSLHGCYFHEKCPDELQYLTVKTVMAKAHLATSTSYS